MKKLLSKLDQTTIILLALVLLKLIIHLATNAFAGYGIFRDEYYYLACSHHLDIGYVDQPPLSILVLAIFRSLFGDSLFALRLLPAVAGALTVLLSGLLVRKLGGGKTAVIIAGLALITAPILLAMFTLYSMNSIDILLWTTAIYLFVTLLRENSPKHWLLLGLVIGLGLANKISMGFLACGITAAVLFSQMRRQLTSRWPYLAGAIALVLFLPYIAWNLMHDLAHLEFIQNASRFKYGGLSPIDFILGQILLIGPGNLPVWLPGIYFYFFHKENVPAVGNKAIFRPLGIVFAVVFLILIVNGHSKPEYLSPAIPMLLAAGGVQIELWARKKYLAWLKYALPAVIMASGLVIAPLTLPFLPVETYIKYTKAIGIAPGSPEAKQLSELPQHYADMFGWENMAKTVSQVYTTLSPEEKAHTVIYARNYGEAASLEYYSRQYALPPVISPHNNYWIWGKEHTKKDYSTIIIIGGSIDDHRYSLEEVEEAGLITCRYCMPYENNLKIYIGRKLKRSLVEVWQSDKHFI